MEVKKPMPFEYCGIGISGKIASGKTTLARVLSDTLQWPVCSLAAPLKEQVADAMWEAGLDTQSPAEILLLYKSHIRGILQEWGQVFRKLNGDSWWVDKLFESTTPPFIVDDVRFQSEFEALRARGFLLIRMSCTQWIREKRIRTLYPNMAEETLVDQSEVDLDKWISKFDIVAPGDREDIHSLDGLKLDRFVFKGVK